MVRLSSWFRSEVLQREKHSTDNWSTTYENLDASFPGPIPTEKYTHFYEAPLHSKCQINRFAQNLNKFHQESIIIDKNQLSFGIKSHNTSQILSRVGIQEGARWQFCSITQVPSFTPFSIIRCAMGPWPWPKDRESNLPYPNRCKETEYQLS